MRFLYNEPAVLHHKALILGDVHFGYEYKLRERGIHDEKFSKRLENKIERLIEKTKAEKLILAGDVKEQITSLDDITAAMLAKLRDAVGEVIIVKGNHDGGIEAVGAGITVVPPDGFVYYGVGIVHGHSWPSEKVMQCKDIISAHQHPRFEVRDTLGKYHSEAVWAIAEANGEEIAKHYAAFNKKSRLILLPAFNPLVGSPLRLSEHLGPILNNKLFKLNHALLFTGDGTLIGKLAESE